MSRRAVRVDVRLPSLLEPMVGGRDVVSIEAATFGGAVAALLDQHPLLRPHLFDDLGALRPHVNLFWNDQSCRWLDSWDVALSPGDELIVVQAVSGG